MKRITAFELQEMAFFKKIMEKSPLKRIESPTVEKKFSSASQKYVGGSLNTNHIVQKHNYLLTNLE